MLSPSLCFLTTSPMGRCGGLVAEARRPAVLDCGATAGVVNNSFFFLFFSVSETFPLPLFNSKPENPKRKNYNPRSRKRKTRILPPSWIAPVRIRIRHLLPSWIGCDGSVTCLGLFVTLERTRLGYRLALSTVLLGPFVDSSSVVVWIEAVLVRKL